MCCCRNILVYLDYVHMHIASYIGGYFIGMIFAHRIAKGYRFALPTWKSHAYYLLIQIACFKIATTIIGTQNSSDLIPPEYAPLVIFISRFFTPFGVGVMILYSHSIKFLNTPKPITKTVTTDANGNQVAVDNRYQFSLLGALIKLSFAGYSCNYLYIRYEFFSRRSLYATEPLPIFLRMLSSLVMIILASLLFQMLCLAPLEVLRNALYNAMFGKAATPQKNGVKKSE